CPHVAGVAALVLSANPGFDNSDLRNRLEAGGTHTVTDPSSRVIPIVDALAAVGTAAPLPSVTITSPADSDEVSGPLTITATAGAGAEGTTVSLVEFFVNGIPVGSDSLPPYEVAWDSTTVPDGSVQISATVTDSGGDTATDTITVTTDNFDDPPSVTITSPSDGGTVSGDSVTLGATANDDIAVTNVEFFVDGISVGSDSSPPYEVAWDSTTIPDGLCEITAVASDGVNPPTTSGSVSVTVNNTSVAVTVTGINPDTIAAGTSGQAVTINGSGFDPAGATVTALNGSGQTPLFSNVTVVDSGTITAIVSVKGGGPPRNRTWDISVTSGGSTGVLVGGFTVTP
ncbi:MAG: hypothetical protein GWO24_12710, partial [Akkermansiaceae bacterium]|nr:hypothetical protein [Akkermansiaceae bacterium]